MTHAIISLEPKSASGAGALDGFEYVCTCGERASLSNLPLAQEFAAAHVAFMNGRK